MNQAVWNASGEVTAQLWSDYEGKWTGSKDDPGLVYDVELFDGAASLAKTQCSTSTCNSRVCSSTVSINNSHSGSCECKMSCTLKAPKKGAFTVRATVQNPSRTFTEPKNLSLVVRQ
jgi:hypothetical protein